MSIENKDIRELIDTLSGWSAYDDQIKPNSTYLIYIDDPLFGKVPMRLFIPKNYNQEQPSPMILLLHGAVSKSSFDTMSKNNDYTASADNHGEADPLFNFFRSKQYVILRPVADPARKLDWVVNHFQPLPIAEASDQVPNPTFQCLSKAVVQVKRSLNIDDSRIYVAGHSDGADGTFCMGLLDPSLFAGFVLYNSLLTNIHARDIYLRNIANRAMYIVHSDLDHLRPIKQTREIVKVLTPLNGSVVYKEYEGYRHFDSHMALDLPSANIFMLRTRRDPFHAAIVFESQSLVYNRCDWLVVTELCLNEDEPDDSTGINVPSYNMMEDRFMSNPYYVMAKSFKIEGNCRQNIYDIRTRGIKKFEILISDKMVDLSSPVQINVNGKTHLKKMIKPKKSFILKNFEQNLDRQAIWLNSIPITLT